MNDFLKYSVLIIVIFISGNMFSQTSQNENKILKDFYNFDNVDKAETTLFKENNYVLIDYKELIKVIKCSKIVVAKFIPKREVVFYDLLGETTYNIYFSETNKYFIIDEKTFTLNKKNSKRVSEVLNYN